MTPLFPRLPRLICSWAALSAVIAIILLSCQGQQASKSKKQENPGKLAGTWVLNGRITEGQEVPVTERQMRLTLNVGGTFRADYRGDDTQAWIVAGRGGFSYRPPMLILHWESGAVSNLMVSESEPDRLLVHHGRNLVPLKDQEPDEIFQRHKSEKGPTRAPS